MVRSHRTLSLAVLGALVALTLAASAAWGAMDIPFAELLRIVGAALGLADGASDTASAVVLSIRLPRVVLGALVGAGLAVTGAAMQAVFRNPLADPALIGVSSGAAVGVVGWIICASIFGLATSFWSLPAAGFVGGLAATHLVVRLGTRDGMLDVTTTLLAGIAINAFAGALIGLAIYVSDEDQLRTITTWTLGSLGGANWTTVGAVALTSLPPIAYLLTNARNYDLLVLGEAEARHLGVDVTALQRRTFAATALLVAASVSFTGIIGFVGLVVPHLVRLSGGPAHRWVMPSSLLLGVAMLGGADLLSRTVAPPTELPIGVVTAFVGAPFFIFLLLRQRTP